MADNNTGKEKNIETAKECLSELNSSLQEIVADSRQKMGDVLKRHEEKKVSDILNELKGM